MSTKTKETLTVISQEEIGRDALEHFPCLPQGAPKADSFMTPQNPTILLPSSRNTARRLQGKH